MENKEIMQLCVETKKKPLVDSTGAGDGFNGVFLSAYIEGYSLKDLFEKLITFHLMSLDLRHWYLCRMSKNL